MSDPHPSTADPRPDRDAAGAPRKGPGPERAGIAAADGRSVETAAPTPGQRVRLPARVQRYWQLRDGLVVAAVVVAIAVVNAIAGVVSMLIAAGLVAAVLVLGAVDLAVIGLRYRTLWFTVGEHQIDLERGVVIRSHTVIPMTRVQHVELERGPLATRFDLAELHIHTAAGAVTIPALDRADGERIRQRIADLARIADDL